MEGTLQEDLSNTSAENVSYNSDQSSSSEIQEKAATVWSKLKPQYKNRLFYDILKSRNIKETVHIWMDNYETDEDTIILEFIQLVIDVASYQFINVKNFARDNEIDELIPHMEELENPVIRQTGKYFLKCSTKQDLLRQKKIDEFVVYLVKINGLKYNLFHSQFHKYCLDLIEDMCKSNFRGLRHTGAFFGLKYTTGVIETLQILCEKMENCKAKARDEENIQEKQKLNAKYESLIHITKQGSDQIKQLVKIVLEGDVTDDIELFILKKHFASEISRWIRTYSSLCFEINILDFLLTYLTDSSIVIRYTALSELGKILEIFYKELEEDHPRIIEKISGRIYDIDIEIASLAVIILAFFYKHTNAISNDIRNQILSRVYCFDYRLAAACGRFLIVGLERNSTDKQDIIAQLIKFEYSSNLRNITGRVALLVEAVIDSAPMLKDLSVFQAFLKKNTMSETALTIFINILTEVVHQTMTGSCTLKRDNARQGDTSFGDNLEFCMTLQDIMFYLSKIEISSPQIVAPIYIAYRKYFMSNP